MIFLLTVILISSSVLCFSYSYIKQEKFNKRFHWLVLLFIASILIIITRTNIIRILLGWDGLGLSSYLLVIYFQRTKSFNAGILTVLTNRVGDIFILFSIACLVRFGSINFYFFFSGINIPLISAILISIAACTKRAQIPFSAWLPAAIAAPTPVSALVHSSTLVTAGVFLLVRYFPCLTEFCLLILLRVGSLTIFIAGISAIVEIDIKKIVALSTLRQLGVIISTIGRKLNNLAFFHLLSHAFFKALLFISVGRIIHLCRRYQDIRKSRLLIFYQPISLRVTLLSRLRLCGIPFTRGFYSKDLSIELFLITRNSLPLILIFFFATSLTCAYRIRFVSLISVSSKRNFPLLWRNDLDLFIWKGIFFLVPWAITRGSLWNWHLLELPILISLSFLEKCFTVIAILFGIFLRKLKDIKHISFFFGRLNLFGILWGLPLISRRIKVFFSLQWSFQQRTSLDIRWAENFPRNLLGIFYNSYFTKKQLFFYSDFIIWITVVITLMFLLYFRVTASWNYWIQIPNKHDK